MITKVIHQGYRPGVNVPPIPVCEGATARPMRYQPEGGAFVITNGDERFNRPLYIGHDGARLDAGDRPEFAFYLPGKGGVLRLGIVVAGESKWLHDAQHIIARYIAGRMNYEVRDPLLGDACLMVEAVPSCEKPAALLQVTLGGDATIELVWAYGGATGETDFRGDIGYMDIVRRYQLVPEECREAEYALGEDSFLLRSGEAVVNGLLGSPARMQLADARCWDELDALLNSKGSDSPVLVGRNRLEHGTPCYLALARGEAGELHDDDLRGTFQRSVDYKRAIAGQVKMETPDPYLNAMAPALCIAGDSLWDGENWFTHGLVAWRIVLLGWRCPYTGDALGWPGRTRQHILNSLACQIIAPPGDPLPAEYFSDGYLKRDGIYDMNLIIIDALMRHLLWNADIDFARQVWPNLKRHLAWEKRCFDRDGIYEAYPAVWASDALQYSGGGAAHSSAYNYYHNHMAARLATLLGEDPTPFADEAMRIRQALREKLWLSTRGWYAEYQDLLGPRRSHHAAALWSVYHCIDSQAADPFETAQLLHYVRTAIPEIPVHGDGVPAGNWSVLPHSTWMPYTWSLNNVAAEEIYHTALAYWQGGQPDAAYRLCMGTMLENMYRGICPGNLGMTLSFDAHRGECIRDFGDTIGIAARMVVEGLFGLTPDALAGELLWRPGFPSHWESAAIAHAQVSARYQRDGREDVYQVEQHAPYPLRLRLRIPARGTRVAEVTLNGSPVAWRMADTVGSPWIDIASNEASANVNVRITWAGVAPATFSSLVQVAQGDRFFASMPGGIIEEIFDPQQVCQDSIIAGDSFSAKAVGLREHRMCFARVTQGELCWWTSLALEILPPLDIISEIAQSSHHSRCWLRNNCSQAVGVAKLEVIGREEIMAGTAMPLQGLSLAPGGISPEVLLNSVGLLPGTQRVVATLASGEIHTDDVINWHLPFPAGMVQETVALDAYFNASVTDIFAPVYLSPRSPYVSLTLPENGVGNWCYGAHAMPAPLIDDSGLRRLAGETGRITVAPGVEFQTLVDAVRNILFVSYWDHHAHEATIPLHGHARHIYLLMTGTAIPMQTRMDNGEVIIAYCDGGSERLELRNPATWWPIEQDYFFDDFAFCSPSPWPPRVELLSGESRVGPRDTYPAHSGYSARYIPGGAATVMDLPIDPTREVQSLTLRATANEVVIGLMSVTLVR